MTPVGSVREFVCTAQSGTAEAAWPLLFIALAPTLLAIVFQAQVPWFRSMEFKPRHASAAGSSAGHQKCVAWARVADFNMWRRILGVVHRLRVRDSMSFRSATQPLPHHITQRTISYSALFRVKDNFRNLPPKSRRIAGSRIRFHVGTSCLLEVHRHGPTIAAPGPRCWGLRSRI